MGFDDVRGVMTRWAGMKCDLGAGVRWWKVAMLNGFFFQTFLACYALLFIVFFFKRLLPRRRQRVELFRGGFFWNEGYQM